MNIYQACCSLPRESAFIFAAGFVKGSKQPAHGKHSERQEKCVSRKSNFSFSNLKKYLKFK